MGVGTPPLIEVYPQGFPAVVIAGEAVSLALFIPADHNVKGQGIEPLHRHRGRVAGNGEKRFVQFYDDPKNEPWRKHVAFFARQQVLQTPVQGEGNAQFTIPFKEMRAIATMRFNVHKPVSYPARVTMPTKKPDIDNLAKAILDALVREAGVLGDDNMVTDLLAFKRYVSPGHPEGVEIDLTLVPTETC